nr:interferon alpha-inducible protein 6 short form [Andrias davidianus]
MSWAAIANGGGVPAGGAVAILQAMGAKVGFSYGAAGVAGATGASVHRFLCGKKNNDKK